MPTSTPSSSMRRGPRLVPALATTGSLSQASRVLLLLVGQQGWDPNRYQQWLADAWQRLLLRLPEQASTTATPEGHTRPSDRHAQPARHSKPGSRPSMVSRAPDMFGGAPLPGKDASALTRRTSGPTSQRLGLE